MQAGENPIATNRAAAFENVYSGHLWGNYESVSGRGSGVKYTSAAREFIAHVLHKYEIKSVVDAAMGAMTWQPLIPGIDELQYTGIDIVPELVADAKKRFGSSHPQWEFFQGDIAKGDMKLPKGDLIMARDLLGHLPMEDALVALNNFQKSGAKYLLTTSFGLSASEKIQGFGGGNKEIKAAEWYPIRLREPPFNLPQETDSVLEEFVTWCNCGEKRLALWKLPFAGFELAAKAASSVASSSSSSLYDAISLAQPQALLRGRAGRAGAGAGAGAGGERGMHG